MLSTSKIQHREVWIIYKPNFKMVIEPSLDPLKLKICEELKHFAVRNFESDSSMFQTCTNFRFKGLQRLYGWRTSQPRTFQLQASTPNLSTPDFSTMNFWIMGLKSSWLKSLGLKKFMVEKSGVEAWGWKVRGWDDLQPYSLCRPLNLKLVQV